jgi:hypothetical protein
MNVSAFADPVPSFFEQTNFPTATGFGVVADTLGDGRFIAYDGTNIWIQDAVGANAYTNVATGYTGDPAIIAVNPDGHTCLVGAGFSGDLWLFDADAPADAGAPLITSSSDFFAEWINATQVVIDRAFYIGPGPYDFEAELVLLDVSTKAPTLKTVISAKGGASAMCVLDSSSQILYTTDGLTGETRTVSVADIVNAFDTSTPVAWTSLPVFGTFSAGGPGVLTPSRTLIYGGFGGLQFVDVGSATVDGAIDPAGTGTYNYLVAYSEVTGEVLGTGAQFSPSFITKGFVSDSMFDSLPALGGGGVLLLAGALLAVGLRRRTGRAS